MKKNFLVEQYKDDKKINISHNYLSEQFSDYNKIDYSKGYPSGFIGKGISKRTQEFAHLMGYK